MQPIDNCHQSVWTIPKVVTEITREYLQKSMPSGTLYVVIPSGVTSIEAYAFYDCASLKQIAIPSGVTSIGTHAFYGCLSLEQIEIPEGVRSIGNGAFSACRSLTQIKIPLGVMSLGSGAFSGCTSLTKITIPAGISEVGACLFIGCSNLRIMHMPDSYRWHIPEGIENLTHEYIKTNMPKATQVVVIPSGVTSIGDKAFSECKSLTQIEIPAGVTSIEDEAFWECSSLTKVEISEGVTSIGDYMFSGCTSVTEINLPARVTSIGGYAFRNCTRLTEITLPFPAGVTRIGDRAFSGCSSLTEINLPPKITQICLRAFSGCTSLTEINLPSGVTSIGNDAFYGCSSLRAIILPDHFCTDAEKRRLGISEAVRCIGYNDITQFYSDSLQVIGLYNTGQKIALYRLCTDESFGQHDLSILQDCLMVDIISAIRKREELLGASENNTILSNRLIGVNQSTEEVSSKLYTGTQQLPDNIISYLTAKDFCNLRTVKSGDPDQSNAPELTVKQFSLFNKITCYQYAAALAIVGIAILWDQLNHSSNHRRSLLGME